MQLINKNILITGATSGIGLELVEQLYKKNTIYIIARNQKKINTLKEKFALVKVFKADLNNIDELKLVSEALRSETPHLDVLINNAAVQYTPTFIDDDFDFDSIEREITTNFTSLCCLTHLLLPLLNHEKPAAILNVNSGLSLVPKKTSAIYCATKGALNIFSQSLRYQLQHTNIKVMQAFLPLVDTAMTKGRGKGKMSPSKVSALIIDGIEKSVDDNDIGKVKLLRILLRFLPFIARNIMRNH
ncbi:putative oxidoreductase DltE [Thalassotalea insulae]|uniref:Oxidoreductase DltE n=1 Tax=Thalassotalea insulae TaxID=2056778 RepID=A0ABQ6GU98_9GAMM|nr:SDR family NAD(P)-dependent oxidoreductase [Thalassotalea insulae]GLX77736.1 putative oxidoreductase DltE [Thalassotalea insulae]